MQLRRIQQPAGYLLDVVHRDRFHLRHGRIDAFDLALGDQQLAAALAEALGRLEREPEAADGMVLRLAQLFLGHPVGGHLHGLRDADLNRLRQLLPVHSGRDGHNPGVRQVAVARAN